MITKIITLFCYSDNMALRDVKPLDSKQWSQLQENMKRGASEKQVQQLTEAKERVKNIKINF